MDGKKGCEIVYMANYSRDGVRKKWDTNSHVNTQNYV